MADISIRPASTPAREWPTFTPPDILGKLAALRRLLRRNARKQLLDRHGPAQSHAERWAMMVLRNRL